MKDMNIDTMIEQHLMNERKELIDKSEWILISDEPTRKEYVSKDNPNFFRVLAFREGPDGKLSVISESTYFEYCRKEVDL